MIHRPTLFDMVKAQQLKEEGIARASAKGTRGRVIAIAREIARGICYDNGTVTSDDVAKEMENRGMPYDQLGNAAGAIFRGSEEFVPTGEFRASSRTASHARMLRVWKLRCEAQSLIRDMAGSE